MKPTTLQICAMVFLVLASWAVAIFTTWLAFYVLRGGPKQ